MVCFGQSATIDVGALVATTLSLDDDDFMNGQYVFSRSADAIGGAAVINEGVIQARENGYVVLAGDYVSNAGEVSVAKLGTVALASGAKMTMSLDAGSLVSFVVDEAVVSDLAGVSNQGELLADGGRVIMTARIASDLASQAVNSEGLMRAAGIESAMEKSI